MKSCACGRVRFELNGSRLTLSSEDHAHPALVSMGPNSVKIEHLTCQTCVTLTIE